MLGSPQPTLRLDCWTSCPLTSSLQPGGQKSTAAPSVLYTGYCRKKKRKKKKLPSIHPNALEGVFGAWLKPHPCCTGYSELQPLLALRAGNSKLGRGRRICVISSHPGFAHPGLRSVSSQPDYRSNTNCVDGGGDAQPGLRPVRSRGELTRERRIHAQVLPG